MDRIFTLMRLERLHRFIFDEVYIQEKKEYSDYEKRRIAEYKHLCEIYPDFRRKLKGYANSKNNEKLIRIYSRYS